MKFLHHAIAFLCISLATACSNGGSTISGNSAKSVVNQLDGQADNSLSNDASVMTTTVDTEDEASAFKSELDPQTVAGQLVLAIRKTNQIPLLDINAALHSGRVLSKDQLACVGDYDAALGVPVLALPCNTLAALHGGVISTEHAAYYKTNECVEALTSGDVSGCIVKRAAFQVATQWIQRSDRSRPTPSIGAHVDYDAGKKTVTLSNLPQQLGGSFTCEIDLRTAALNTSDNAARCDIEISRITNSLNALLTPL